MAESNPVTGPGPSLSPYLVSLVADAQAAATRLERADEARRRAAVEEARVTWARLSARLDASPLTDETADAVDAGSLSPQPSTHVAPVAQGGWARALKLEGMPTQDVAAVEYANLLACFDAEPTIARDFFEQPAAALTALHGIICAGLIDVDLVGAVRSTPRAVSDGAQGRMIYAAPEPHCLPDLLASLTGWLGSASVHLPDLVVAGVVHERILEWQPFEAGNGRVARAAARVVLRARGLDPHGVGVAERTLAADPGGYHGEVAATKRRRGDLGLWLERYAEAVADALVDVADRMEEAPPAVSERAVTHCRSLAAGCAITLAEYARAADVSLEAARRDLTGLRRAGLVRREPGTRGLRHRVR